MSDKLRLKLTNGFYPKELPLTLIKNDNTTSLIPAFSALGRLGHSDGNVPEEPGSSGCVEAYHKRRRTIETVRLATEVKPRAVMGLLI